MSRPKPKQLTVTFQPEPDVAEILAEMKPLRRGETTRRINEALRRQHKKAALTIAVRELEFAKAKVRALKISCRE